MRFPKLISGKELWGIVSSGKAVEVSTPEEATHFSSQKVDGEEFSVYIAIKSEKK